MNDEECLFQDMLFVVLPGGQCYGTEYDRCADEIVDVTRQEDFLAQVGFYGDDVEKDAKELPQVASHFTACTPAVFATTQLQTRCFVHVCEGAPDVASYRSQRKALRKERRRERTQKRLKYDDEEKLSTNFTFSFLGPAFSSSCCWFVDGKPLERQCTDQYSTRGTYCLPVLHYAFLKKTRTG